MPEPRSVLRSLILIFLSGWIGIAAQPAEAQQTVTLSGRVTDAAGNAVSGATVSLEDPGWVGQETDANGDYRLMVPPGTYRLRVRPPRGPLIAQKIEGLALSTNTTRSFVLETGVMLSGRVTGSDGQPAPWAWLSLHAGDYQEVSFGQADPAGRYSLGVPVGTYHVDVYHEDFPNKMLEGVAVSRDTVLNITLEAGALLEGEVIGRRGPTRTRRRGVCLLAR